MTFDEWWKDSEKSVYWCNNPDIRSLCKCIAQSAWEAAQPKWTYCKDRLPKEKDGKVITTHETDASFYSHEIKVIRVYVKLETQNPFNETRIDNFCLSTNKFEKYEDLVIAWMSLPEYKEQTK